MNDLEKFKKDLVTDRDNSWQKHKELLKDNEDYMIDVINHYPPSILDLSERLKNDEKFLLRLLNSSEQYSFNVDGIDYNIYQAFSNNLKNLIENSANAHPWINDNLQEFLTDIIQAKELGFEFSSTIDFYKQLEFEILKDELDDTNKARPKKIKL